MEHVRLLLVVWKVIQVGNKGFTTVELITSFTLASVIMLILFNVIIIMKDNLSKVKAVTSTLVEKDNLSYNINKRLKEKELTSLTMCEDGDKCFLFTYSDDTSDKLIYSSIDKTITFNNYTFNIIDGITVEEPVIKEYYDTMSSTTYNGYFIIHIPITVDDKDYSIKINKHFNTDSVLVDVGNYWDNSGNEYTMVNYLKSTGTQYIDTGILSTNAKIDISFKFNEVSGRSQVLINCAGGTVGWFGLSGNEKIILDGQDFDINYSDKHDFTLEYKNGTIKATDEFGNSKQRAGAVNTNFTLLAVVGKSYPSYANLYYTKIYDNDTLVRDYVPVIDSNSRPCLFDRVSKECYYNQGTGEFLYG